MNCNFTCVTLDAQICGETYECVAPDAMNYISLLFGTISCFTSIFWILASDEYSCRINKYQCVYLTFGSCIMLGAVLVNLTKDSFPSKKTHYVIKLMAMCFVIVYTITLCGCASLKTRKKKSTQKKLVKQNNQQTIYNTPENQDSILDEASATV